MNQNIETSRQHNLLTKVFDKELYKAFIDNDAFIAGGAISSLFTNRQINDFDIYFPNSDNLTNIEKYFGVRANWSKEFQSTLTKTFSNKNTLTLCDPTFEYGKSIDIGNIKVQLVTAFYGDIHDIFNTFDFHCCMGAYTFKTGEFTFDPLFVPDNMSRTLRYNYSGSANPLTTFFRIEKYKKYGYSMPTTELLKVAFAIKKIKVETRSDLKAFVRMLPPGVYKNILVEEIMKPLSDMHIDFNDEAGRKAYAAFMNGPCDLDSLVDILMDLDSYIDQMHDEPVDEVGQFGPVNMKTYTGKLSGAFPPSPAALPQASPQMQGWLNHFNGMRASGKV